MADKTKTVEDLSADIEKALQKYDEEVTTLGKAQEETKKELEAKLEKFAQETGALKTRLDAEKERTNDLETKLKNIEQGGGKIIKEGPGFAKELEESDQYKKLIDPIYKGSNNFSKTLVPADRMTTVKDMTVGDLAGSGSLTGRIPEYMVPRGIVDPLLRPNHMRDIMAVIGSNTDFLRYFEETAKNNAPTTVAEGGLKPLMDFELTERTQTAAKIAVGTKFTTEMLRNLPYITGYVQTRLTKELRLVEDNQILYGDGNSPNLEGITVNANIADITGIPFDVETPQYWDVIAVGIAKVRVAHAEPTAVIMHPWDFHNMTLLKDTQGRYLAPIIWNNSIPTIYGLPILTTTAVTQGNFLIGNFASDVLLVQSDGLSVRFFDQNEDDARRNKVLIQLEESLLMPVFRPGAFVYDTFADGIAEITAP